MSADPDAPRLTDFNDVANVDGLAVVERQIADAVAMATWDAGGTPLAERCRGRCQGPAQGRSRVVRAAPEAVPMGRTGSGFGRS